MQFAARERAASLLRAVADGEAIDVEEVRGLARAVLEDRVVEAALAVLEAEHALLLTRAVSLAALLLEPREREERSALPAGQPAGRAAGREAWTNEGKEPRKMGQKSGKRKSEAARQPTPAGTALTRAQVADRLGTSIASVRRMEDKTLHPTKGADGVNRFDPAEVEAIAAARTTPSAAKWRRSDAGELAAEAFTRFKQGLGPRDVVIELRQPPDVIHALHRQWRESGGLWLPSAIVTEIRRRITSRYDDPPAERINSPQDLLDLVDHVVSEIDNSRQRLLDRVGRIRELHGENEILREKLKKCRRQLTAWAQEQESAASSEKKPEGPPAASAS